MGTSKEQSFKPKFIWILLSMLICSFSGYSQHYARNEYTLKKYRSLTDSIKNITTSEVIPDTLELSLAIQLALSHYPELYGNRFKVRIKSNVRHPITASWSFWNVFKKRKNHKYVLLLSKDSFLFNIKFNEQVGAIGHEMAHFSFYKSRPAIGMLTWGLKYTFSGKYRSKFEKEADITTISHGLGWQLIDIAYYHSREEIASHMLEMGYELRP